MYSFDVFDTLITRTTALPNGIFALMQSRLMQERELNGLDDYVIDNFFELRIGTTPQNFNSKMKRESFTIRDLEDIAHVLDCTFERNFILPNGDKV